jgi:hypothetical protein
MYYYRLHPYASDGKITGRVSIKDLLELSAILFALGVVGCDQAKPSRSAAIMRIAP